MGTNKYINSYMRVVILCTFGERQDYSPWLTVGIQLLSTPHPYVLCSCTVFVCASVLMSVLCTCALQPTLTTGYMVTLCLAGSFPKAGIMSSMENGMKWFPSLTRSQELWIPILCHFFL